MHKITSVTRLQEDGAAVGGGSVAMAATPLFATLVKRTRKNKLKVKKMDISTPPRVMGVKESFNRAIAEAAEKITSADVVSKLKDMEARDKADSRDIAVFGLEDDNGNTVKVSVKKDQADSFENALHHALSQTGDDSGVEIAEVLFALKDQFDIVDVDWGNVEEDEEQLPPEDVAAGEPGDGTGDDLPDLAPTEMEPSTDDVSSLLKQVIDMMKADAEARRSEALAKAAESKAKEAEAAAQQAAIRVKQEEQILDMESHEKKQKEIDKEAKRLAKLAKWRHDMADLEGADDSDTDEIIPPYTSEDQPEENEEVKTDASLRRVSMDQLSTILLQRAKK